MGALKRNRLLAERPLPQDGRERGAKSGGRIPVRSVTVNLAESPLGWLKAWGMVTERQFEAGERLRMDWERAQMEPSVTMRWDAPPTAKSRAARLTSAIRPLRRSPPSDASRRRWRQSGPD